MLSPPSEVRAVLGWMANPPSETAQLPPSEVGTPPSEAVVLGIDVFVWDIGHLRVVMAGGEVNLVVMGGGEVNLGCAASRAFTWSSNSRSLLPAISQLAAFVLRRISRSTVSNPRLFARIKFAERLGSLFSSKIISKLNATSWSGFELCVRDFVKLLSFRKVGGWVPAPVFLAFDRFSVTTV